jgi:transcriptional regulator with XRE-family HTH domain
VVVDDKGVGANLRRIREGAALSQSQLASAAADAGWDGVYAQTILKIEKGSRSLKVTEIPPLALALGMPPVRLVSRLLGPSLDPAAERDFEENVRPAMFRWARLRDRVHAASGALAATEAEMKQAKKESDEALTTFLARHGRPDIAQEAQRILGDGVPVGTTDAPEVNRETVYKGNTPTSRKLTSKGGKAVKHRG